MPRRWVFFGPEDPPERRKPFLEKIAIAAMGGILGAATGGLGAAAVGASIAGGAAAGGITSTYATLKHGGEAIEVVQDSTVHQAMQPQSQSQPPPAQPRPETSFNPMSAPTVNRTPAAHAPPRSTPTSVTKPASPSQHWDFNISSKRLCTTSNNPCTPAHSGVISSSTFEKIVGFGPIPTGNYKITAAINHHKMGLNALKLDPADQDTRQKLKQIQRGGFYVHGPSSNPTKAFLELDSRGCIVVPKDVRRKMHVGDTIHVTP